LTSHSIIFDAVSNSYDQRYVMYIYLEMSGSCKRENEWAYKGESESLVKD